MELFSQICQTISDFGMPVVTVAILIIVIISLLRDKKTGSSEHEKEQDAKLETIMKQVIVSVQKDATTHTLDEQEIDRKVHDLIQVQLSSWASSGLSRAYYWRFHNGGKDVQGRGLMKMSMSNEVSNCGKYIMKNWQNIPRTCYTELYNHLCSTERCYPIRDIEDIKDNDSSLYMTMVENGAKSVVFVPIIRDDGLVLGFIGGEHADVISEENEHAEISRAKRYASIITGILMTEEVAN